MKMHLNQDKHCKERTIIMYYEYVTYCPLLTTMIVTMRSSGTVQWWALNSKTTVLSVYEKNWRHCRGDEWWWSEVSRVSVKGSPFGSCWCTLYSALLSSLFSFLFCLLFLIIPVVNGTEHVMKIHLCTSLLLCITVLLSSPFLMTENAQRPSLLYCYYWVS